MAFIVEEQLLWKLFGFNAESVVSNKIWWHLLENEFVLLAIYVKLITKTFIYFSIP